MKKHSTRCVRLLALVLVMLLPGVETRASDVFLETTRSKFQKISIWIMGFGNKNVRQGDVTTLEEIMADVLKMDLQRSQLFEVIEASTQWLDPADASCQGEASLAEVGMSDASVVTWGRLGQKDGKLVVEVCAHDGGGQDIAVSKRYYGGRMTMSVLRRIVHRWADELVKFYTGEPGVAETRIVYAAGDGTAGKSLYVMDYDGFRSQRITPTHNLALTPTWLPDQNAVAYMTYRQHNQEIVQLDLASRALHTLVSPQSLNMTPSFSTDGEWVAYASAQQGHSDIFTMNVQTKEKTRLTDHARADFSPTWSPDGRNMAFVSDREGAPQIYIMHADGSRVRRLTFHGSYNVAPTWSPRGDWIAYVCRVSKIGFRLCLISPDGQQRTQITKGSLWALEDSPSWAPDGRHLVFSSMQDGQSHLYMINVDGTGLERLTWGAMHHSSPDWSS